MGSEIVDISCNFRDILAERQGFEPWVQVASHTRVPGVHLQPLGHLSIPFHYTHWLVVLLTPCLWLQSWAIHTYNIVQMSAKKTTTPPVIELRALEKRYGIGDAENLALNGVDLVIEKGEFISIMGPSGCGKTTLLNILGLLDRATDGDYFLDGTSVERLSGSRHAQIRAEQIGIIFQHFNLIERLPVIENVALPLTYRGIGRTKRLEKASQILKTFHLSEREYYMPWQLSGGQMQRVAIARALVNQPSIILADEPTGNLDTKSSHVIMEELSDLHKRGNTIIMVTHNPDLTSYASRVIHMLDGRIDRDSKDPIVEPDVNEKVPLGTTTTTVRHVSGDKIPLGTHSAIGKKTKKSKKTTPKKSAKSTKKKASKK